MNDDIYASLTSAQLAAVQHMDGPLLILAGPGSGKTRVVTHRMAHLLQNEVDASQILALTFTNKAADEMRLRLQSLAPHEPVWMGTFHRFCAKLLRRYAPLVGLRENYSIFDTDDSMRMLKLVMQDSPFDPKFTTPDSISKGISWAKNELIPPDRYTPKNGNAIGAVVRELYPKYQQRLLAANAVDFDDLLMHVATLLRENPELRSDLDRRFRYIMVDEYQDTNLAQYAIVRALSNDYPNLAVTGDPDQSIYGWRGANIQNILDFEKDFPEVAVVRLEQNYRSTKAILRVAQQLISQNKFRKEKDLYTDNEEGDLVSLVSYPTHRDEAGQIAERILVEIQKERLRPRDIAIFYRVNALSRVLETALRERNIPYQIVNGHEFFKRKEIKDILAYLHLLNNPENDIAFLRTVNTPARGIGATTLTRLREFADRSNLSLLEAARQANRIDTIKARGSKSLIAFAKMIDTLCLLAAGPVEAMLGHVLTASGYQEMLKKSTAPEDQDRLANTEELLTDAREFDARHPESASLEAYLEQTSLVADTDAWEAETDKVTLMTLHAAKGLEFEMVFIIAVEEGILPHDRSREDQRSMEEERRLLFVGITRAQSQLQLSYAKNRAYRGGIWPTVPSKFLMELPRDEMHQIHPTSSRYDPSDPWNQEMEEYEEVFEEETWEEDYSQVEEPQEGSGKSKTPGLELTSHLMTAADLMSQQQKRGNLNRFKPGMLVDHPDYGRGSIVALSGNGPKRTATIEFEEAGQKSFRLLHAPLELVGE